MVYQLYVLKLRNKKWYVGTTQALETRYEQHKNGTGSEWTRLHPPTELDDHREISQLQDRSALETKETYKLMLVHGVNNVRGGPCIQVEDYTGDALESLVTHIGHTLNMDFSDVRSRLGLPPRGPGPTTTAATSGIQPPPRPVPHSAPATARSLSTKRTGNPRTKRSKKVEPFSICARCGEDKKSADPDRPLCRACWKACNFDECPCCGADKDEDPERPLCPACYRSWKRNDGTEPVD